MSERRERETTIAQQLQWCMSAVVRRQHQCAADVTADCMMGATALSAPSLHFQPCQTDAVCSCAE